MRDHVLAGAGGAGDERRALGARDSIEPSVERDDGRGHPDHGAGIAGRS